MSDESKVTLSLVKYELATTFRFPMLEIILALVIYVIFLSSATTNAWVSFYVSRSPTWDGTSLVEMFQLFVEHISPMTASIILDGLVHPLGIIVPLLIAASIAGPLEDGTIRTLLTYPISRYSILGVKTFLAFIILCGIVIGCIFTSIILYIPRLIATDIIFLMISAVCLQILLLISITSLISVLAKKMSVATIGAIGFWYSYQLLMTSISVDTTIRGILNPITAISTTILMNESIVPMEIFASMVGSLILSLVILTISFKIFARLSI